MQRCHLVFGTKSILTNTLSSTANSPGSQTQTGAFLWDWGDDWQHFNSNAKEMVPFNRIAAILPYHPKPCQSFVKHSSVQSSRGGSTMLNESGRNADSVVRGVKWSCKKCFYRCRITWSAVDAWLTLMAPNMFLQNAIQPVSDQQVTAYMSGLDRFFFMLPLSNQSNELKIYNSNWIGPDQKCVCVGGEEIRNNLFWVRRTNTV